MIQKVFRKEIDTKARGNADTAEHSQKIGGQSMPNTSNVNQIQDMKGNILMMEPCDSLANDRHTVLLNMYCAGTQQH